MEKSKKTVLRKCAILPSVVDSSQDLHDDADSKDFQDQNDVSDFHESRDFTQVKITPSILFCRNQTGMDTEKLRAHRYFAFKEDLRPLLFCLKLFGIYFENSTELRVIDPVKDKDNKNIYERNTAENRSSVKRYGWFENKSKIYSTVILMCLWVQCIRMISTSFTYQDTSMKTIISKLIFINYTLRCAILFTSYYLACYRGRLDRTFRKFSEIADCDLQLRNLERFYTAAALIITILNTGFMSYMIFFPLSSATDSLIAPINTMITGCSPRVVLTLRVLFAIFNIFMNAGWTFTAAASTTITTCCTCLYSDVNSKVKRATMADGRFDGNLEKFRQKHQRISRLVDEIDKYLSLFMGAAVVFNISALVLVLYSLIFNRNNTSASLGIMSCWMFASTLHLMTTALGAVKVNSAAHKLCDKLPNIDLSTLSTDTMIQLNVFLKTLSGSPIGFTVLRIFVIDRNTILTILGLFITYFLLIVQFPISSDVFPSEPHLSVNTTIQDTAI